MARDECIVHGNLHALQFQSTLKQLRREKKFPSDIYRKLPEYCCSCDDDDDDDDEGSNNISIDDLETICHELLVIWSINKKIPYTKNLNKLIMNQRAKQKNGKKSKAAREEMELFLGDYPDEYFWDYLEDSDDKLSANNYDDKSQLPISSRLFQPRIVLHSCIVHNRRYVSQFARAVRTLKTVSDFAPEIYHELLNRCCSCDGREGVHTIDPILLRSLCCEIDAQPNFKPDLTNRIIELSDLLILPGRLRMPKSDEYRRRVGLLIGKRGRNLSDIQAKYNVRINIVTDASSLILQERLRTLLELYHQKHRYNRDDLYILFDIFDGSISKPIATSEIKELLRRRWASINDT